MTAGQVSRAPDVDTRINGVAFSPDGRLLATAEYDGTTRLIEVATGQIVAELKDSDESVSAVAFTPDGQTVLAASFDGLIRSWDVRRRSPRVLANTGDTVVAFAVDPTGRQVAVPKNEQILLLDSSDGHRIRTLVGHIGYVHSLAFASGNNLLISGGTDGTVRAWDVASGDVAALFHVPGGHVNDIAVAPGGRRIAVVSTGSTDFVFDCEVCRNVEELVRLAAVRATCDLTPEERLRFAVP